jgi:hypothetical protein
MSDEGEWGPWIEHDGSHLPPHGTMTQATFDDCQTLTGIIDCKDETHLDAFLWRQEADIASHVIRYRVRKPRGLICIPADCAVVVEEGSVGRVVILEWVGW